MTEEDEEALAVARTVLGLLPPGSLDGQTLAALVREWGPTIRELLPGIAFTGAPVCLRGAGGAC